MSMLAIVLVVVLVLAVLGTVPHWGWSRDWGYAPSGSLLGLVLIVIVVLWLTGHIGRAQEPDAVVTPTVIMPIPGDGSASVRVSVDPAVVRDAAPPASLQPTQQTTIEVKPTSAWDDVQHAALVGIALLLGALFLWGKSKFGVQTAANNLQIAILEGQAKALAERAKDREIEQKSLKTTLDTITTTTADTNAKAEVLKIQGNSMRGDLLRQAASLTQQMADINPGSPTAQDAAAVAQADLVAHEQGQAAVVQAATTRADEAAVAAHPPTPVAIVTPKEKP